MHQPYIESTCPQTENIRDGVVTRSGPHRADIRCHVVPAEPFRPPRSVRPARHALQVARASGCLCFPSRLHLYHRPVICILLLEREGKTMNDQASSATSPGGRHRAPCKGVFQPLSWRLPIAHATLAYRPFRLGVWIFRFVTTQVCGVHSLSSKTTARIGVGKNPLQGLWICGQFEMRHKTSISASIST